MNLEFAAKSGDLDTSTNLRDLFHLIGVEVKIETEAEVKLAFEGENER